jgi:uncharacterized phiE125 gp8 family phage protein
MTPKVISVEGEEPLTVAECRTHLEAQAYEDSDVDLLDDAMIEGFRDAAVEHCANFLGLTLITSTLEIALDEFPDDDEPIDLPLGPVRSIVSVSWGDESDDELDAADFVLDNYRKPAQLKAATTWPDLTAYPNILKVRYIAGYGVDSDGGEALPKIIRAAILVELTNLYENRGDEMISTHAANLLRPMRVRLGMA